MGSQDEIGPPPELLVVQTAQLGDIVMTLPLLREIRRLRRRARITLLTTPVGRGLLEGAEVADRVLELHKGFSPRGLFSWARIAAELARGRFEVAVAAQRSTRTGQALRLSGAPVRVGFAGSPGQWSYTHRIRRDPRLPATKRLLELSRPFGGDPLRADSRPSLTIRSSMRRRAVVLLERHGVPDGTPYIVLAPGSARRTKRWTREGFARLARSVLRSGYRPVLAGSSGERRWCNEIAECSGLELPDLTGETPVALLAALLAGAHAVVANDSGAGHLAAATGTPVVSIFGPTSPSFGYAPSGAPVAVAELPGLDCRPCSPRGPRRCPLGHRRCMRDLEPERVQDALDRLLGSGDLAEAQRPARIVPG